MKKFAFPSSVLCTHIGREGTDKSSKKHEILKNLPSSFKNPIFSTEILGLMVQRLSSEKLNQ